MTCSAGKRVLMLLENLPYTKDIRVIHEAKTLVSAGYRVSVICPKAPGEHWRETLDGVRVYRYRAPLDSNSLLGYVWEYSYSMMATFILSLYLYIREDFDVIHAHNPPDTFVFIGMLYKLFGKRFIFDHHDLAPEMYYVRFKGKGSRLVYVALLLLEKLSCRLADHVIAVNESYRIVEMERGRVPPKRVTIVRNGPDLNTLQPMVPKPDLGHKGKTIIAYVGVMGFQDGLDHLLRALHHLLYALDRKNFFCFLVGSGDALPHSKSLSEELKLAEHVLFTGWLAYDEVAFYISGADICVAPEPSNPYNDRSTMIKIMEYMSMGKPIVAFDLLEHRITASDAAIYARPNDELDFARQIASLMDDSIERHSMGRIGRKRIEKELAWHHQAKYLLRAYESLGADSRKQH